MANKKCPCCGGMKPSERQIEAFRLVIVQGMTQTRAAEKMGITKQVVSEHLEKMRKSRPELFSSGSVKILSYDVSMDYEVKTKF